MVRAQFWVHRTLREAGRRPNVINEVCGAHQTLRVDGCRPLVNVAPNFFFEEVNVAPIFTLYMRWRSPPKIRGC